MTQTAFPLPYLLVTKELLFPIHRFTSIQDNFSSFFYFSITGYSLPNLSFPHLPTVWIQCICHLVFICLVITYEDISALIMNYYQLFLLNALPSLPNQHLIKILCVCSCASALFNKIISIIVVCNHGLLLRSSFSLWATLCRFFVFSGYFSLDGTSSNFFS